MSSKQKDRNCRKGDRDCPNCEKGQDCRLNNDLQDTDSKKDEIGSHTSVNEVYEQEMLQGCHEYTREISQYFNNPKLSDIKLIVGMKQFYAHRFILAKASNVFKKLLLTTLPAEVFHTDIKPTAGYTIKSRPRNMQAKTYEPPDIIRKARILELEEEPEAEANFDLFLKYLYTGIIEMKPESAPGVLCLAQKYKVKSLKDLVWNYMVKLMKPPNALYAVRWFVATQGLNDDLYKRCLKTILDNFEDVIKTEEWQRLDKDLLICVLKKNSLVVTGEHLVFEAALMWLKSVHRASHSFDENACDVLKHVRFPQMHVDELYEIETGQLAKDMNFRPTLFDMLGRAYRFRSIGAPTNDKRFQTAFYQPRNYTETREKSIQRLANKQKKRTTIDKQSESENVFIHSPAVKNEDTLHYNKDLACEAAKTCCGKKSAWDDAMDKGYKEPAVLEVKERRSHDYRK